MITKIEQLLHKHFCALPFHNLNMLYGQPLQSPIPGGTCSDKSLAFLSDIRTLGVDAFLHTANIGGKEIHRLVRVNINGCDFFADVGNGWPTIRLLPSDQVISFECYGMKYRTEVTDNWVRLFHKKQGKESLQLEINISPQPEHEILAQIKSRYSAGIDYPFSHSFRFSLVVGNKFLFLRGHRLEKYSKSCFFVQELSSKEISGTIEKEFGYNVDSYFSQ